MVISGFNVGLMAVLLELFLRMIGVPLRLRLLISGACLLGYCVLTGMQAPVARATLMAWVVLGALGLDRVIHWPNALAVAALAILWLNPFQLFDPGFQLSFGAVASLLLFTTRFRAVCEPLLRRLPSWFQRYVALSLASTAAVWVGLWPLLAWYFHLISPVSVLANLLLVPLVSLLVGTGTVVLLLGAALESVVRWAGPGLAVLVDLTVGCVQWCHRLPWGFWPVGHPSGMVLVGYYALVIVSLIPRRLHLGVTTVMACWLVGFNLWLWGAIARHVASSRWLEITVLDVGHGDSVVIRTPSQHTLVVDVGTEEAGRYSVVPFLRFKGWHTVDALVLTHPDEDHIGGTVSLLRQVRVKQVLTNGFVPETASARRAMDRLGESGIPHTRLTAGVRLTGELGADILTLHPPASFVPGPASSSNDNSVVLRVAKGDRSLLLCGDLEEAGLPWIVAWERALHATVLKVPHHGSALGRAGRLFFERVHPMLAVISVGRRHHLPSTDTLQDLAEVGAQTLLTREQGAVTIRTDGKRLVVDTFRHHEGR